MERAAEATRSAAATLPHECFASLPSVFQGGSILFVTGAGSQAAEATVEFLPDNPRLNAALASLKINPTDPRTKFEIQV
jgi:hypothetical protein